MPVGGRTRRELETIVGDFVNVLPIRVEIPANTSSSASSSASPQQVPVSPQTPFGGSSISSSSSPTTSQATFRQVLRLTKTSLLKGLMNQEYPFGLMVEKFCPFRDATKSPLFQILFVHEKPTHRNASLAPFVVGDAGGEFVFEQNKKLCLQSVESSERQCQFDIVIAVSEGEGGQLSMRMQYSSSLFFHETAVQLAQQWVAVTSAALSTPSAPVHEISLLTKEQQKILEERNQKTLREFDALKEKLTAHQIVEKAVARWPGNPAVSDPLTGVSLTYEQLNSVANALAKKLRSLALSEMIRVRDELKRNDSNDNDTETETLQVYEPHSDKNKIGIKIPAPVTVAILLIRSVSTVVCMLAASKAGVSYVPIDTKSPADRIRYILKDSGALVVLYHEQSKPTLDSLFTNGEENRPIEVNVDEFVDQSSKKSSSDDVLKQTEKENLPTQFHENYSSIGLYSPLYQLYTSGSTGNPKGVVVHHGGLVSVASWFVEEHKVLPNDVSAQSLGAAFDPVNIEVWPYLFAGASIVILDDETKLSDPQTIVDFLHKHKATHITFPTVLSVKIFQEAKFPQGFAMKSWSCGGDKFSGTKRPLTFSVINAYGPTEASILCTQYPLNFDVPEKAFAEPQPAEATRFAVDPPIGTPTANTALYVLDEYGRHCPPGMVGELVVAGAQVAVGYHRNSKATSKVFVRDPFEIHSTWALRDADGHPRMYHTGDLVRYDGDFNLHFVGRKDFQVKIRGFRIELGEIETQLLLLSDSVLAAQVIVYEGPKTNGEKRLFGFVVPAGDPSKYFGAEEADKKAQQLKERHSLRKGARDESEDSFFLYSSNAFLA